MGLLGTGVTSPPPPVTSGVAALAGLRRIGSGFARLSLKFYSLLQIDFKFA